MKEVTGAINKGEAHRLAARGIFDRGDAAEDLRTIMTRFGNQPKLAADALGVSEFDVVATKKGQLVFRDVLLTAMYGERGNTLLPIGIAKDTGEGRVAESDPAPAQATAVVGVDTAAPAIPVAKSWGGIDATEEDTLRRAGVTRHYLVALVDRAKDHYGSWPKLAEAIRWGVSTLTNSRAGIKRFSAPMVEALIAWRDEEASQAAGAPAFAAVEGGAAASAPAPVAAMTTAEVAGPLPAEPETEQDAGGVEVTPTPLPDRAAGVPVVTPPPATDTGASSPQEVELHAPGPRLFSSVDSSAGGAVLPDGAATFLARLAEPVDPAQREAEEIAWLRRRLVGELDALAEREAALHAEFARIQSRTPKVRQLLAALDEYEPAVLPGLSVAA